MINYTAIAEDIADVIGRDDEVAAVEGIKVAIEVAPEYHEGPYVLVHLERRDAPADRQSASAGLRTRYLVRYMVTVFTESLGEILEATRRRDDLAARVERALMRFRGAPNPGRIEGTHQFWLEGGAFDTARGSAGFNAAAEIAVVVDVTATV